MPGLTANTSHQPKRENVRQRALMVIKKECWGGDPAGTDWSGEEWGWWTQHHLAAKAVPGARFYIVAWGKLRGWAPITRLHRDITGRPVCICREGNAIACTIAEPIPGFQGLRERWWQRETEMPFPDWRKP